jgi:hypothetical protein
MTLFHSSLYRTGRNQKDDKRLSGDTINMAWSPFLCAAIVWLHTSLAVITIPDTGKTPLSKMIFAFIHQTSQIESNRKSITLEKCIDF